MHPMTIGDRKIGDGHPCFIIFEIGVCHNGSVPQAKLLIDLAKSANADAVKLQKRDLRALYTKDILLNTSDYEQGIAYTVNQLKRLELSEDEMEDVRNYAKAKGMLFSCTAFDVPSFKFLKTLDLDFHKIGSPTLNDIFLLNEIINDNKPVIMSTGMSTEEEISLVVDKLKGASIDFALCHCISAYPSRPDEMNLKYMDTLRDRFDVQTGLSSHEIGTTISTCAVSLGASIIERHITLNKSDPNPDSKISLEPQEFNKLVRDIRKIEKSLGSSKKYLTRSEYVSKQCLSKSLVAKVNIKKGDIFTKDNLTAKSPGHGMSPLYIDKLLGRESIRDIKVDEQIDEIDTGAIDDVLSVEYPYGFGLVGRFSDIDSMLWQKPKLIEFHLTDRDLENHIMHSKYDAIVSFHMPEYLDNLLIDISSTDDYVRKVSVDVINRTIDVAVSSLKYCNNDRAKIVVHPGGAFMSDVAVNKDVLYDNLHLSIDELKRDGVDIFVENLPYICCYFNGSWYQQIFMDPDEIIAFCEKSNTKMCFDVSHAILACNKFSWDILEYTKKLVPYMGHLHISDGAGLSGEGLQIDDGECPWKEMMDILPYKTALCLLEIWRGHLTKHLKAGYGFAKAMQRLAHYLV